MVLYSFPAGLFHSLQHAGLSRRTVSEQLRVSPIWTENGDTLNCSLTRFPRIPPPETSIVEVIQCPDRRKLPRKRTRANGDLVHEPVFPPFF